jgi:ABC-type multidrug transport system ATPase subunit/pSer/pThr/pTyr-binding forkhead associated (FHA) protein
MDNSAIQQKAYLIALDASLSSREYVLDPKDIIDSVTIGRDGRRCQVVAAGRTISRKHAHVKVKNDTETTYWLEDIHSTNGVYINGQRIDSQVKLNDGDLIGLGSPDINHLRFQNNSRKNVDWTYTLKSQAHWLLGRSADNDISLPFESVVSAYHAILHVRKDRLEIIDRKSLNGIWVSGKRIKKTFIDPSDTVVIGSTFFHFLLLDDGRLEVSRRECGDDIHLDCVGVGYHIPLPNKKQKKILDDITLSIQPGEFVGILGPSGAGKSTLLKTLNGYIQPTTGRVMLNDTSLYHAYDMFRNSIGYVPQDDILHRELSVEKSLEYVAKLRLPRDFNSSQRKNIIDSTIEALGLNHVRQQPIERLSGGQRKRVSIGSELLTKPSVLFLDEPTSGLDPSVEEKIMRHFQKMAHNGTTVLITTHILYSLDLLDRIIILSQGKLVFFGTPKEALEFFQNQGKPLTRPIEIFDLLENPQQNTTHPTIDFSKDQRPEIANHYSSLFHESELYQKNITAVQTRLAGKIQKDAETFTLKKKSGVLSILSALFSLSTLKGLFPFRDCLTLTKRHLDLRIGSVKRALLYGLIPLLLALVTLSQNVPGITNDTEVAEQKSSLEQQLSGITVRDELIMKGILSSRGKDEQRSLTKVIYSLKNEGVQSLPVPMSVMVMCVMTAVFLGTICTCLEISTEKSVYERERKSSLRIADYLGSKLPLIFCITSLQCGLFLLLLSLSSKLWEVPFIYVCPVMILVAWCSATLGLFVSTMDPTNGQLSVIFAIAAVLPQLILSGGLGPDYYNGLSTAGKFVADCIPARWGLEMMFTVIYQNVSLQSALWIPDFVENTIGYRFGGQVIVHGAAMLLMQAGCWLLLSALLLKRRDHGVA